MQAKAGKAQAPAGKQCKIPQQPNQSAMAQLIRKQRGGVFAHGSCTVCVCTACADQCPLGAPCPSQEIGVVALRDKRRSAHEAKRKGAHQSLEDHRIVSITR